jgi:ABC-type multidrug transport system fused ATPase/permease subunit
METSHWSLAVNIALTHISEELHAFYYSHRPRCCALTAQRSLTERLTKHVLSQDLEEVDANKDANDDIYARNKTSPQEILRSLADPYSFENGGLGGIIAIPDSVIASIATVISSASILLGKSPSLVIIIYGVLVAKSVAQQAFTDGVSKLSATLGLDKPLVSRQNEGTEYWGSSSFVLLYPPLSSLSSLSSFVLLCDYSLLLGSATPCPSSSSSSVAPRPYFSSFSSATPRPSSSSSYSATPRPSSLSSFSSSFRARRGSRNLTAGCGDHHRSHQRHRSGAPKLRGHAGECKRIGSIERTEEERRFGYAGRSQAGVCKRGQFYSLM